MERGAGRLAEDGPRLTEEEAAEVWKQSGEVLKEMKKLGCAMVLVPATIVTLRMLLNT